MYVNQNKKVKNKKLEKSALVLNPGRDEKSNALLHPAIMFTIIISKSYQRSDPLVSPWAELAFKF